jgi:hypothetical protein
MSTDAMVIQGTVKAWLPTTPARPAPELMDTATTLLILNLRREKDPESKGRNTLSYYQQQQGLKSVRVGKKSMFRLDEVLRFVKAKESQS